MSTPHRRKPYMPDSDSGKALWMQRFIKKIEADPKRYGFDDPVMFEYVQRAILQFIIAVQKSSSRSERSPSATLLKNQARAKAVEICRDIAMRLKWDSSLSDAEKRALGINAEEAAPEDAKLPQGVLAGSQGYPELFVNNSPNGGHLIRYRNITTPSKAKPKGVSHLLLFAAIGEKPNMRRTHARLLGAYTRRPFEIVYPMACGIEGMYVTYFGRWLTTRGEMSPWSPGISKMIGDTSVSLHESGFSHLFEKNGFIDALPARATRIEAADRPLLQSAGDDGDGVFAAMEARMDAKMLPWEALSIIETQMARREVKAGQ
jgi:hypothetical protein